jgi:hypothetical protein
VLDSGCTNHLTGGKEGLEQFIEDVNSNSSITFGDTSKGKVLGRGKLVISKDLSLENIMLVESLGYNLLSVHHLCSMGYNSYFTLHYVKVFRSDNLNLVFTGHVENGLYVVDFSKESPSIPTCLMAKVDKGWLWHRRLAHVNMRNLKRLLNDDHVIGLTDVTFERDRVCSACVAGKQLGKKHPSKSIISTSSPLEILHLYLFGPTTYVLLVEEDLCLSLLMIILGTRRYLFSSPKMRLMWNSLSGTNKLNILMVKKSSDSSRTRKKNLRSEFFRVI